MSQIQSARRSERPVSDRKLTIDEDLCTACRLCEERAPENLEVEAGACSASVIKQPVGEQEIEACQEAADYCPTGSLQIDGGPPDEPR